MKKSAIILLPLLMVFCLKTVASEKENLSIYTRETISLDGAWNYIVDPYENGYYNYRHEPFDQLPGAGGYYGDNPGDLVEYNFDKTATINVPGDWNTQDPKFYFYEGTTWYRKKFDSPDVKSGERIFLYFGAINYRADVYLNAEKLGVHVGGFTPFYYEVTDLIRSGENSLVIKVDNKRLLEAVPTVNTDWWNYGGITRSVEILIVPATFIRDYQIKLESRISKKISGKVFVENAKAGSLVKITFPELKEQTKAVLNKDGEAPFSITPRKLGLWSPDNPKLYRIEISTASDKLIDTVGFRSIETRGKQVLLNGEPVFLRGICIHEENATEGGGRVNSPEKAEQLLSWAKELGCNFVRLAHYPHNEDMVRIAEKMGILVWSEIPVYWTIDWENEDTYANAENQLKENILRDRNRANVIIWSLANETPVSEARNLFLKRLAEQARNLDNSRLLSAAMEKHYKNDSVAIVEDPLADIVDIVSYNQYIGWYDGLPEKCDKVSWEISYNKPVFISEFGAGAKYGYHGEKEMRWTEEYQEELYIKALDMLDPIDGLCGMSPWILTDFRSPRRPLPEIQDDFNRKGLLSEKGEKKKAFFVLQKYYLDKTKK